MPAMATPAIIPSFGSQQSPLDLAQQTESPSYLQTLLLSSEKAPQLTS